MCLYRYFRNVYILWIMLSRKSWTTPEMNCCTSKENWAVYNDFNRERSQGSVIIGLLWSCGHPQTSKQITETKSVNVPL